MNYFLFGSFKMKFLKYLHYSCQQLVAENRLIVIATTRNLTRLPLAITIIIIKPLAQCCHQLIMLTSPSTVRYVGLFTRSAPRSCAPIISPCFGFSRRQRNRAPRTIDFACLIIWQLAFWYLEFRLWFRFRFGFCEGCKFNAPRRRILTAPVTRLSGSRIVRLSVCQMSVAEKHWKIENFKTSLAQLLLTIISQNPQYGGLLRSSIILLVPAATWIKLN